MTNEQLVLRIQAGDDPAGNMARLYEQNRAFIFKSAGKLCPNSEEDKEDAAQEAYFGLLEAVNRWDPDSGTGFLTYAGFWIWQSMSRYIHQSTGAYRLPEGRTHRARRYNRTVSDFQRDHGRPPTPLEACRAAGIDPGDLEEVKADAARLRAYYLDRPINEEGATLADLIPAEGDPIADAVEDEQRRELARELWAAVDALPEVQADVIRARYRDGKSMQEAGEAVGGTAASAASMERRALQAIRRSPKGRRLAEYLTDSGIYANGIRRGDSTSRTALANIEREAELKQWLEEWTAYNADYRQKGATQAD